ncbi:uncharacterized protein MELLADRAFT_95639 [Melampsora larici-populina 98AG31]|uniref:Uncharacterized protein n=1 Tax=Melampsora larici-populina (strain 98AG31 / pathotype 3-4-7) TaxID=747676 RepID=F4SA20_MELLP|nr:uncharacterized protein MELLADRAFT_95639 [Melampsora larici-populina 98AG31]EGF98515.1 hypothetical protein MELLADRAFT_95639 [Melampsora larici-populina 98AG31]
MPPCILHDDEVLGNHLDTTKGEPALELIFLAEKYYSAHPNIARPLTSATTAKTKRGKRKALEELTISDQELDDYFSSDNSLGTARYSLSKTTRKKSKSTPSTSTRITSPPLTRTKRATTSKSNRPVRPFKSQTNNNSLSSLPPLFTPPPNMRHLNAIDERAQITEVVPPNHILVAFDFRAPMDISAFGQNFPMAAPLPSNPTSDGFIDGKRLHMQSNSKGKPEWKAVQYYFKVDESIKIGEGGFRICYKAFGKDATGDVIPMVAKKRMVLPYRKSVLDVHRESGGTYAAVASVIEQFKQKALESRH